MNDQQTQILLEAWFEDTDPTPPDTRQPAIQVMARVPQTPQRGRWWPLPTLDRPALIPASSGRMPARGFTMFSALKFVAAAAVVALFGGFLLTGILATQQGDEVLPAAVTESPSPMTTEELLSGMVTEEVEPGVFRVIGEEFQFGDLLGKEGPAGDLVSGGDGSIWLLEGVGFYRLGGDKEGLWPEEALDSEAVEFVAATLLERLRGSEASRSLERNRRTGKPPANATPSWRMRPVSANEGTSSLSPGMSAPDFTGGHSAHQ